LRERKEDGAETHSKELFEVNRPISVCVNVVDHVLHFGIGGVLAERAHYDAKFLVSDGSITI